MWEMVWPQQSGCNRIGRPAFFPAVINVSKSPSWSTVLLLSALATTGSCLPWPVCRGFPTADFRDVALSCSSPRLQGPPLLLPQTLQALKLSQTAIRALDSTVFRDLQLPQLHALSITDGVLSSVEPRALCSLPALSVLDLSNNKLEQVAASSLECNLRLRRLDLSDNPHLGRLPALSSASLDTLDADRCDIADVGADQLRGLPALRILHLRGNPRLDCSTVRSRLSLARPALRVFCDGGASSAPLLLPAHGGVSSAPSTSGILTMRSASPQEPAAFSVGHAPSAFTKFNNENTSAPLPLPIHTNDSSAASSSGISTTRSDWPQKPTAVTVAHASDTFMIFKKENTSGPPPIPTHTNVSTAASSSGISTTRSDWPQKPAAVTVANASDTFMIFKKENTSAPPPLPTHTNVSAAASSSGILTTRSAWPQEPAADTVAHASDAIMKFKKENTFVVTYPKQHKEMGFIFMVYMGVCLPLIFLFLLIICFFKRNVRDEFTLHHSFFPRISENLAL